MGRAACAWTLWLAASVASAQDVPVFSSGVEVVRVDVSVLRDGKTVEGLQANDFELRDNGVLQSVEIIGDTRGGPGGAGKQVDVVLALDVSDSVRGAPLEQLKAAAHAFVDILRPEDSFSLLTFSGRVQLSVAPGDSRARAHEVIEGTRAQLTTSLNDAAFAAVITADASRGRPLALILSDGEDRGSWLKQEQVLRAARSSEIVVHVVITRQTDGEPPFVGELAATTGGAEWRADYARLREVLEKALEEFRSRYTLRYERRGRSRAGWHQLDIRVHRPGVKVRARRGYEEEPGGSVRSAEPVHRR
jgi:VWFA-related protein